MRNWNKLTRPWNMRVCIFQFPIDTKIRHKWLGKCNPKDKFNERARRICLIYFSMATFIDNIKFILWYLNINNLMIINFHISLITKRFFRSFDRHSDKTVTLIELLTHINKFRDKMLDFFRKFHECGFWIVWVIVIHVLNPNNLLKKCPSVNTSTFFFFNGSQNWVHLPIFYTSCALLSR